MTIIDAFVHAAAGEKPADLAKRNAEIYLTRAAAMADNPGKDRTVTAAILEVPDGHGFCIVRPGSNGTARRQVMSDFRDACTVAFGSGNSYGTVHAVGKAGPDSPIPMARFITQIQSIESAKKAA